MFQQKRGVLANSLIFNVLKVYFLASQAEGREFEPRLPLKT